MAVIDDIVLDGSTPLDEPNNNGEGNQNGGDGNQDPPQNQNGNGGEGDNGTESLLESLEKDYGIKVGEQFEIEGEGVLSVDENGNLLKENGEIFKNSDEVKQYLESINSFNDDFNTLEGLKSFLDYEPLGDDNKPIVFSDTPEGRKAYIDSVMLAVKAEAKDEALDELFKNEPEVANFYNFIKCGGDPRKYLLEQDRTSIEFDQNDVESQKNIIRQAWIENNNAGNADDYINYLEAGGSLADVAKQTLESLKQKDAERKQQLEKERKAQEEYQRKQAEEAINNARNIISNGDFDGCKIPDNVTLDKNGRKVTYSKQDFEKYLFARNVNGYSQYDIDRAKLSPDILTKRFLLDAWITFTGGSYKDIVNMAVKDNEVKKLRLIAKKATQNSGKPIYTPKTKSANATSDVVL